MEVAIARKEAGELKRDIDRGRDPQAERDEARSAPTVAELADRYLLEHADAKKKRRSAEEDRRYTAIPRGCNTAFAGGETVLKYAVDDDAAMILAVAGLLADVRRIVQACALQQIRPNWMEGVEPRLVERRSYFSKGKKRKGAKRKKLHRLQVERVWEPCHPETIRVVREIYSEWHAALERLARELAGRLAGFEINAFSAPATPWLRPLAKTA